ncbi:MAG: carboxypeptidase-like regulatory domain-containing protein [candidate division WOR-3 bacterium]
MKKLAALFAIGALTGLLLAGTGGITGRVTDLITGNPIANAVVVACSDSTPMGRAQTNEDGVYLIEGLEPGGYQVIARKQGYVPAHYPTKVIVQEGQITTGIDLRLRQIQPQTGAISGRVTDKLTGEPIHGAVVYVHGANGRHRMRTDRQGYYIIRGLRPGRYQVSAKARRYFPETYPEPVEVRRHEVTENINFALQPKPRKGGIIGQVVDAQTGYPIAGVLVIARGEQGEGQARTDGRGFYRIGGLNPGVYELSAFKPKYQPQTYPELVPVRPGSATRGIDFRLEPLQRKVD